MVTVDDLTERLRMRALTPAPHGLLQQDVENVVSVPRQAGVTEVGDKAFVVVEPDRWVRSTSARAFCDALVRARTAGAAITGGDLRGLSDYVDAFERAMIPLFVAPPGQGYPEIRAAFLALAREPGLGAGFTRTTADLRGLLRTAELDEGVDQMWVVLPGCVVGSGSQAGLTVEELRALATAARNLAADRVGRVTLGQRSLFLTAVPQSPRSGPPAWLVWSARPHATVAQSTIDTCIEEIGRAVTAIGRARSARASDERRFLRRLAEAETDPGKLAEQAQHLGVCVGGYVFAVTVTGDQLSPAAVKQLSEALRDFGESLGGVCLVGAGDNEVHMIVVQADLGTEGFRTAVAGLTAMTEPFVGTGGVTVGTSSRVLASLPDLFEVIIDARQDARLSSWLRVDSVAGLRLPRPVTVNLIADDREISEALHESVLSPILRYDAHKGSEYARTLAIFLSTSGQWNTTAARLGIHINTLRYRLSRVEKLTGRSIGSMADRVDFYIALCLHAVLGEGPSEKSDAFRNDFR